LDELLFRGESSPNGTIIEWPTIGGKAELFKMSEPRAKLVSKLEAAAHWSCVTLNRNPFNSNSTSGVIMPKGRMSIWGSGPYRRVSLPKVGMMPKSKEQQRLVELNDLGQELLGGYCQKKLPFDHILSFS
jgi:hypothetical protein